MVLVEEAALDTPYYLLHLNKTNSNKKTGRKPLEISLCKIQATCDQQQKPTCKGLWVEEESFNQIN